MRIPKMKVVSDDVMGCPACSKTFALSSYSGTPVEQMKQIDTDYFVHFKSTHSSENASQAAARIVREATEDK